MKALTVWQPWASLIGAGHKPYEFRGWRPPKSIIGQRIAIHAGARKVQKQEVAWLIRGLDGTLDRAQRPALADGALSYLNAMPIPNYPRSAIVCTAVVGEPLPGDECARRLGIPVATNDSDREGTFNWGWPMLDIKKVPGIPCRGAQGQAPRNAPATSP